MVPNPQRILPLLHCPVCSPSCPLTSPATLHCGHTVCAIHVRPTSCPVPTCSTAHPAQTTPNIPPSSSVAFFPAQPQDQNILHSPPTDAFTRSDVTIGKILPIVYRALAAIDSPDEPFIETYHDSGDESDEEPGPSTPPSASPPPSPTNRSPSPSSSRPRKRLRRRSGQHHSGPPQSRPDPLASFDKELTSELTCEICFMLLYQPVTTPCQHTFCSKCLQRSLDHSMLCPLCREELPGYAYFQEHPHNKVVLSILLQAYPETYAERGHAIEVEERDARLDTPIFVCQLSFPGLPTLLHFFEPRYRLMLRRCLEAPSPIFGMIMPPRAAPIAGIGVDAGCEFGTMLEIRSVQMLPDGRSMVETWGSHRFRLLERGSLDGYMIGRVERIDDDEDDLTEWAFHTVESSTTPSPTVSSPTSSRTSLPSSSTAPQPPSPSVHSHPLLAHLRQNTSPPALPPPQSTSSLISTCNAFLDQLRAGTAPWVVQRLNHTYGPQPPASDPAAFSFWMGLVLPIDEHEKAKLLPLKSPRLRLQLIVHWIEQLNSNWWFSSGCSII
ncbi:PUA-like domain-containing protein [Hygrophoropsis aurantiaca]|uniref:PUA-like domain-containing protein n=1 Tax=Hygrophoropsis aurantiaca TaxID=72124 RepID=A0ACB8ANM8_9AGAM|nr:PUA-like domain-containing protein [Hygrophoropsis aurantiaca]